MNVCQIRVDNKQSSMMNDRFLFPIHKIGKTFMAVETPLIYLFD